MDRELDHLRAEAQRVRAAGALGRSQKIQDLFEFFVNAAEEGRPLREFDVACEVFGKDVRFDPVTDATVRVHVHRLRRKLDEFYASRPTHQPRLNVPRGEYRLALTAGQEVSAEHSQVGLPPGGGEAPGLAASAGGARLVRRRIWYFLLLGWVAAAVLLAAVLLLVNHADDTEQARLSALEQTALWRDFANASQVKMLLLEETLPPEARESSDRAMANALPIAIAPALRDLLPLVHHQENVRQYAMVVPMGRMRPEMIKRHSFVYVGFVFSIHENLPGLLEGSGFEIDPATSSILDRETQRRFVPSRRDPQERDTHMEYAYLAAVEGPATNRIVIVAGTANASLQEAAKLASDPAAMQHLSRSVGEAPAFEALYQVSSTGELGLGARLIRAGARPSPSWALD